VALVLKPHAFDPTRAGFFFREPDGRLRAERSYQEFQIDPMPLASVSPARAVEPAAPSFPAPLAKVGDVGSAAPQPSEPSVTQRVRAPIVPATAASADSPVPVPPVQRDSAQPDLASAHAVAPRHEVAPNPVAVRDTAESIKRETPQPAAGVLLRPIVPPLPAPIQVIPIQPAPVENAQIENGPVETAALVSSESPTSPEGALPRFLAVEPKPSLRLGRWLWLALAVAATAGCGYFTRGLWWDETVETVQAALDGGRPPQLGLHAWDSNGQLQIQWNANSRALRKPRGARLTIADGSKVRGIPLDLAHLASGAYTYAREGGRVDVSLAITQRNGEILREVTSFLGKPIVTADTDGAAKEIDDLRTQNDQLKTDFSKEHEKTQKLEHQVRYLRDQLERELRLRRLEKGIDK